MKYLFKLLFLLLCSVSHSQRSIDFVPGECIVSLSVGTQPESVLKRFMSRSDSARDKIVITVISSELNLYLLKYDPIRYKDSDVLHTLRMTPEVRLAQFNHYLKERNIPNDPQYAAQWQWKNSGQNGGTIGADTKAELAWNISTGGLTPTGDTIVVAVIDSGIDLNHEDLKDNIWYNIHEVPNNNIDDDGNGYIDDYRGWNVQEKNDNTQSATSNDHGVKVSGLIGAKGNNGKGVTGVNWNVKIMTVRANNSSWLIDNSEVNVIAAYAYILKMRKLYNQTKGAKGAYVVATNASWGADEAKPEDSPIWCNFYDTLGVHGVLNCGATTNNKINVDIKGDLPTTCPSQYLISVQSSNNSDVNSSSGFGKVNIDLAAPGVGILSTGINNSYKFDTGTSFAAPIVAGAIALLYSSPNKLVEISKTFPAQAPLFARKAILESVDKNPSLADQNASGGRINLFAALNQINQLTGKCIQPLEVEVEKITDKEAVLKYQLLPDIQRIELFHKKNADLIWKVDKNIFSPFIFKGLSKCTEYDYYLRYFCNSDSLDSPIRKFSTMGCCEVPDLQINDIQANTISLGWTSVLGSQRYDIRIYKGNSWDTLHYYAPNALIGDLDACTSYDFQIRAVCDTTKVTNFLFGAPLIVKTKGCGACTDFSYCTPKAISSFEWIRKVKFNTLSNTTGASTDGFSEYPTKTTTLGRGQTYPIELTPAYNLSPTDVHFRIWMDYNQDGKFDYDTELVFDKGKSVIDTTEYGTISIPWSAKTGICRMRIGMRTILANDSIVPFLPCGNQSLFSTFFGEFEDYCIVIEPGYEACKSIDVVSFAVTPNSILVKWDTVSTAVGYEINYRKKGNVQWEQSVVLKEEFNFKTENCSEYELKMKTICQNEQSEFSKQFSMKSYCTVNNSEITEDLKGIVAFPNPFENYLKIEVNLSESADIELELYNTVGQSIEKRNITNMQAGTSNLLWKFDSILSPAIYFVKIKIGPHSRLLKVIKV
ncbi:MAG: S8 family serine peptidase [Saprospiraceae bacterium]